MHRQAILKPLHGRLYLAVRRWVEARKTYMALSASMFAGFWVDEHHTAHTVVPGPSPQATPCEGSGVIRNCICHITQHLLQKQANILLRLQIFVTLVRGANLLQPPVRIRSEAGSPRRIAMSLKCEDLMPRDSRRRQAAAKPGVLRVC